MKETSRITYDFGKLKRFLTVVRLMMQDTLFSLIHRCYNDLFTFIEGYIPTKIEIISPNNVINHYSDGQ